MVNKYWSRKSKKEKLMEVLGSRDWLWSATTLAKEIGVSRSNILTYLKELKDEHKIFYVRHIQRTPVYYYKLYIGKTKWFRENKL